MKDGDMIGEGIDYFIVGFAFDTLYESAILPMNLRVRNFRVSGYQMLPEHTNSATVQKMLRDWVNLNSTNYPGAGSRVMSANQVFAMEFTEMFYAMLEKWFRTDAGSYPNANQLSGRNPYTRWETRKCLGRTVQPMEAGPELIRRMKLV